MLPLCVGERAWDRVIAHVEAVVMATEDVVSFRKISAVPESYRPPSSLVCLRLCFSCSHVLFSLYQNSPLTPLSASPILSFLPLSPLPLFLCAPFPCILQSPVLLLLLSLSLLLSSTAVTDINRGNKLQRSCQGVYLCVYVCLGFRSNDLHRLTGGISLHGEL